MAPSVALAQFVAPKVRLCEQVEFNNGQEAEWHPGFVTNIGGNGSLEIVALVTEGRDQFDDSAAMARIVVRTPCRHVDDPHTRTEEWTKYTIAAESGGLWRKHQAAGSSGVDASDMGKLLGVIESLQERIEALESPPKSRGRKSESDD